MNPEQDGHTVDTLLEVLDLTGTGARTREDIFTGRSHPTPNGRVYGGQVLAQALIAAEQTLPASRTVHSMHGYFLRPGDASLGITFAVDRIHDGRSFSTRRTQAYQHGEPIFSMISSFQDDDPGVEHAAPMPAGIPGPESVAPDEIAVPAHPLAARRFLSDRPADIRHVQGPIVDTPGTETPSQAVWMRVRSALPSSPGIHRAALAYLSDMTIQESVLRAHGLTWLTPGLKVASLDHAMWWHRPARADEWLLYVQESPNARGGRGLASGRIYTREGTLIASVTQEIMVRVPDSSAAPDAN